MSTNFNGPKGSIWRKWDLHFHTPSSYDYKDKSVTNEQIIEVLKSNNIAVVAITDHHTIDVERILELQELAKEDIKILPGIEFCAEVRGEEPIHFIAIFPESDKTRLEYIKTEILSKTNINKQIQDGKSTNEIYCDIKNTVNIIKELGGVVTIHAGSKSNTIENITNTLPVNMAQKKNIAELIDVFELGKAEDQKDYRNIVFPDIKKIFPMIICSDNHDIKNYTLKQNCWIKADPTFEGLKQIIYEPKERIYIEEEPEILKRVRENKTKFIKAIRINQISGYNQSRGVWFKNIEIPLNPGLVAIIGNKGNGKSALTDIISLCGNSHLYSDFSFLKEEKFLKDGLAKNFEAELIWESGESIKKNLADQPDQNSPERVRYLPQNFFERLTNNLETYDFEKTLKEVVFSYIPDEQKLGKKNFDELIEYKKELADRDINNILDEIRKLNKQIIELEKKSHPNYKKQLEEKLKLKKKELEEHNKIKPKEVPDPTKDEKISEELKNKQDELSSLKQDLENTENEINQFQDKLKEIYSDIEELRIIKNEIKSFKNQLENYIESNREKFSKYGLEISNIIKFEINDSSIEEKIKEQENKQQDLKNRLLTEEEIKNIINLLENEKNALLKNSLKIKEKEISEKIEKIKGQLSEPQKKYQQYLEELKKWEDKKKQIEGDENTLDTIKWFEKEIKYIDNQLSNDITDLRNKRLDFSLQIYNKKKEITSIYKSFKDAVDRKIQQFQNILGEYEISIDASLKIKSSFYEDFLKFINQKVRGSFYGIDEGKSMLINIVREKDINTEEGLKNLLSKIIDYLEKDKRENFNNENRNIKDQILNEEKWIDFYDYIFSLNYIEPTYELKLGNKNLSQLSPGEKGALLIVFYLLLDKENIPLIIDQPEENLDNESVYKILRHFIINVKRKRQVIIVTHNPNLAIAGDAEQIIFVKIDKKNNNTFSFESGSIENRDINKHASDILEGTLKAFDIRRLKYLKV
jgi:predicted ATPase